MPSYSIHDVVDIFRPGHWDPAIVDKELGYAPKLKVNSLRVFVTHEGYHADGQEGQFVENYKAFQGLMKKHNLTLMTTFGIGQYAGFSSCENVTAFTNAIVAAESRCRHILRGR